MDSECLCELGRSRGRGCVAHDVVTLVAHDYEWRAATGEGKDGGTRHRRRRWFAGWRVIVTGKFAAYQTTELPRKWDEATKDAEGTELTPARGGACLARDQLIDHYAACGCEADKVHVQSGGDTIEVDGGREHDFNAADADDVGRR